MTTYDAKKGFVNSIFKKLGYSANEIKKDSAQKLDVVVK